MPNIETRLQALENRCASDTEASRLIIIGRASDAEPTGLNGVARLPGESREDLEARVLDSFVRKSGMRERVPLVVFWSYQNDET